jgi:hypothetical protein
MGGNISTGHGLAHIAQAVPERGRVAFYMQNGPILKNLAAVTSSNLISPELSGSLDLRELDSRQCLALAGQHWIS